MSIRLHPRLKHWFLSGLILGFLWFTLINNLRLEWSVNPQYGYGWAVPFLCLYLLYLRSQQPEVRRQKAEERSEAVARENRELLPETQKSKFKTKNWVLFGLALLWLPIRLIAEANPEWRLTSWALALVVVGLTLSLLWLLSINSRAFPSPPRPGRILLRDGEKVSEGRMRCSPQDEGEVSIQPDQPTRFRLSAFRVQDFVFPILFFLVAVPWPTIVEAPLIQWLTRANAACGIELLNLLGVPAVQHGNLIEVGTGVVGIDEACSGIRSFQASLMISLFFGELYRLKMGQRILFVLAGFGLAFAFNVARTTLLTWVAARDGVAAIDRWHDTAGVTILVACFLALWLLGLFLSRRSSSFAPTGGEGARRADEGDAAESGTGVLPPSPPRPGRGNEGEVSIFSSNVPPASYSPHSGTSDAVFAIDSSQTLPPTSSKIQNSRSGIAPTFPPSSLLHLQPALLCSLAAWLLFCEIAVEGWYRWHESRLPAAAKWTVAWPTNNPTFKPLPFSEKTRQFLRHDEGANASWNESDGTRWQVIFLRWNPGKIAVHLAQGHTPQACLPASGRQIVSTSEVRLMQVGGLALPFRHYVANDADRTLHVFYCLWEDRGAEQDIRPAGLTLRNRLEPVLAGHRNRGQRSLELAVWGLGDSEQAQAAFHTQLEKLIRVEK